LELRIAHLVAIKFAPAVIMPQKYKPSAMQPSEIIAQKINRIGPKLPRGTRDVIMHHLATGADIFTEPRLRGSLFASVPGTLAAYRALEQAVGVTFRIERA
jgi:hypothetical protein